MAGKSRRSRAGSKNAKLGAHTVATRSEDTKRGIRLARAAIEGPERAAVQAKEPSTTETSDKDVCVFCLELLLKDCVELPCKHKFHQPCVHRWLCEHSGCPTCRESISVDRDNTESDAAHHLSKRRCTSARDQQKQPEIEKLQTPIKQVEVRATKPSPTQTWQALGYSRCDAENLKKYGTLGVAVLRQNSGKFPSRYMLKKFADNNFKLLQKPQEKRVREARTCSARVQLAVAETSKALHRSERRVEAATLKAMLVEVKGEVNRIKKVSEARSQCNRRQRKRIYRFKNAPSKSSESSVN